ncbi:hypothetical protein CR162_15315 [Pseudoroseomonas rhizosphaerae]|uniref:Uncharacterized protein n=1 Tax=Teichococcus rhizosphaerae TaxID=1335062 RepID=A0A2C7A6Z1_9PROT|nr:hypothetical protein [Pseudoroseomonas rhizosphaerae]PHK94130.1 hypothetical protein CR162_15315 [Pseudoroseomonas rhizosphaerae]
MISATIRMSPSSGARLKAFRTVLPAAAASAANDAAFEARAKVQEHMRMVFDRPTPGVLRAVQVKKATPAPTATATVFLGHSDPGFQRRLNALGQKQERGGVARPSDVGRKSWAVPIRQRTNGFGGLNRGTVPRLLRQKLVFVGRPGGRWGGGQGQYGVYRRARGRAGRGRLILLVALEQQARYPKRMAFVRTGREAAGRVIPHLVRREMLRIVARAPVRG